MSNLSVALARIQGRQYRTNLPVGSVVSDLVSSSPAKRPATAATAATLSATSTEQTVAAEELQPLPAGVVQRDGQYVQQVPVSPRFYGAIIGRGGATLQKLQQETQAKIEVPGKWSRDTHVTITAPTLRQLEQAGLSLQLTVEDAKAKSPPTHFVSLPLNTPQIQAAVADFHSRVKAMKKQVPEAALIDPASFHLTIGVLKLFEESEIAEAKTVLRQSAARIQAMLKNTAQGPIVVEGLAAMGDNAAKANVLYAKAGFAHEDKTGPSLQDVADAIFQDFSEAGLMTADKGDSVLLHATLINTRHAVTRNGPRRIFFDATEILEQLGSHHFGEADFQTLHLSRMHRLANRYYTPESIEAVAEGVDVDSIYTSIRGPAAENAGAASAATA